MTKKKQPPAEECKEVVKYEPTEQEKAVLSRCRQRAKTTPPIPMVKVDGLKVGFDHPDFGHGLVIMMEAMATTSTDFAMKLQNQLINALSVGQTADQEAINFGLAVIASIKPRDELETMLAAQMAAIHCATMTFARRLNHVETIPQQDSAERALNKLARTFTTQLEALKRYRTGGEQKVTVHHVTVNEGGQAIVGTVGQTKDRGEG